MAKRLPNGTEVDTRKGRVTITASAGKGKTEKSDFYDGLFKVSQTKALTTVTLSEKLTGCKKRSAKASAAAKKPKTRKLWGNGKGKFRTRGQYGAATIRGTQWLVQDTCTSTIFKVKQGSVNVRDDVKKKTVIVRKGQHLHGPREEALDRHLLRRPAAPRREGRVRLLRDRRLGLDAGPMAQRHVVAHVHRLP